ncbi:hypothetical protein QE152_g5994 [Popillia japonica]|uniref:Uncharacterized protein n=1 Tax=Popillia japonica TaxID=7064 RepID=A0AAW1MGH1_POPJA
MARGPNSIFNILVKKCKVYRTASGGNVRIQLLKSCTRSFRSKHFCIQANLMVFLTTSKAFATKIRQKIGDQSKKLMDKEGGSFKSMARGPHSIFNILAKKCKVYRTASGGNVRIQLLKSCTRSFRSEYFCIQANLMVFSITPKAFATKTKQNIGDQSKKLMNKGGGSFKSMARKLMNKGGGSFKSMARGPNSLFNILAKKCKVYQTASGENIRIQLLESCTRSFRSNHFCIQANLMVFLTTPKAFATKIRQNIGDQSKKLMNKRGGSFKSMARGPNSIFNILAKKSQ